MKSQKQRKRKYVKITYPTKRKKNNMEVWFWVKIDCKSPIFDRPKKWWRLKFRKEKRDKVYTTITQSKCIDVKLVMRTILWIFLESLSN